MLLQPLEAIIMCTMRLIAVLVLLALCFLSAAAQTPPPGNPYDAARYPNPIITFVEEKDFKDAEYSAVQKDAGIEILGLSQDEGKREALAIAPGKFVKNMPIYANIRSDVTFYPVIRQTFKLTEGADLILHSFKFPRVSLPPDFSKAVLNEAATEKKKKPSEMRFGGLGPEVLEIRGTEGLLFEKDGKTIIYWQEAGVGHTATSTLPRRELFRVIEDLL
jgi:hypothetical protein